MTRIVLAGFRGTGKTTIGVLLSKRLGIPLSETDRLIVEKTGMTIPEIFEVRGEDFFRAVERDVIASLPVTDCVISCGGGAVLDPDNVRHLRAGSLMVLLDAPAEVIVGRLEGSDRPSLTGLPPADEARYLMQQRRPAYCRASDICIPTGECIPGEVVERIISWLHGTPASPKIIPARKRLGGLTVLNRGSFGPLVQEGDGEVSKTLFAVIGNPCGHSRSPALFSALFSQYDIPGVYIGLEPGHITDIWEDLQESCTKGLSVTIPFKESVLPLLDGVSDDAAVIGAVNTVIFSCGRSYGMNTDWEGIAGPLSGTGGADALVMGAGGAARAAVYAILRSGFSVTVTGRTPERAMALAERFGVGYVPLSEVAGLDPDLIVNTTPVGMAPDDPLPVPEKLLRPGMTVFDLVYTPPETSLLKTARERGCRTIPGTEMFINQACAQFFHFTGIRTEPDRIRSILS